MTTKPSPADSAAEDEIERIVSLWREGIKIADEEAKASLQAYIEREVRKTRIDEMLALRNYFEPGIHSEYLEVIDKYTNDRLAELQHSLDGQEAQP